jgi:tetratricopeptide (TPR) repeat protein
MTDLSPILTRLHQNLAALREREAKYGSGLAPVELQNQLDDHIDAIALTEQAMRGQLSETDWRDRMRPLLVDIRTRSEAYPDWGVTIGEVNQSLFDQRGQVVETQYNVIFQQAPPQPIDPQTLAEAEAKLAALPLETLPQRATLPAVSRMPLSANPHFVGRVADLRQLAAALKDGHTAAIGQIAVATGLGGIGKTQLAAEFVHRYGPYFAGGVFWLNMADPAAVQTEVAACGPALTGQGAETGLPFEEQISRVASAWQSPLPRLLVFDNCESENLLAQWRPHTGGCRVLVTSRNATWSRTLGVQAMRLGVLPRAESVALLRRHRPDLTAAAAEAIAAEVGDLPLALHLAGSFLAAYRHAVPPVQYLAQLRDRALLAHPSLQGRGAEWSPTGHELHVARTFALSYKQLDAADDTDALALQLLGRAACFAAGTPIPRPLLLLTITLPDDDPDAPLRVEDALHRLAGLGLLETEADGALWLHRLVAAFVVGAAPDDGAREAVEKALWREASRLNKTGYPAPLLAWQSHLRAVTEAAMKREDERAARLCNELGGHLNTVGDYAGARPYYERALAIRRNVLRAEHPDTAVSLNNLGGLLYAMGDYAGARPYLERALAINEKVFGAAHPYTAESLNNLGGLLDSMGDYAGARPYYERALAICEKKLVTEHPLAATSLNNLGFLLYGMGDYVGARPYLERALAIWEKRLGAEHPDTAVSLNNLGELLQTMGDYVEAWSYVEGALVIREKVLGAEHPDTAQSLNNLGGLLQAMGNYAGARLYYERALAIWEKRLGAEHPNTKTARDNLQTLLDKLAGGER